MSNHNHNRIGKVVSRIAIASLGLPGFANAQHITLLEEVRAQGMSGVEIQLPSTPDRDGVIIEIRRNGSEWRSVAPFSNGHKTLEGHLFPVDVAGNRTRIVPLYCDFGRKPLQPIFSVPGEYDLRLKWYSKIGVYPPIEPKIMSIELTVKDASDSDLGLFLDLSSIESNGKSKVGSEASISEVPEREFRGWSKTAYLATAAIHEWRSIERVQMDPDVLANVVRKHTSSTYSPYLSYLAGIAFSEHLNVTTLRVTHGLEVPDPRIADLSYYQKAESALRLSMVANNAHISPMAGCHLAELLANAGAFDEANDVLRKISNDYSGQPEAHDALQRAQDLISKLQRQ